MTGTFTHLFIACLAFVGGHFLFSGSPLRTSLVNKLGENPFKGVFSVFTIAMLVWMVFALIDAPREDLWDAPTSVRHLPLTLMIFVMIFLVAAEMRSAGGRHEDGRPKGVHHISRHPMAWAIIVWALMHIAATGHVASLIFFGSFVVLGLIGPLLGERRRAPDRTAEDETYFAHTSFVPFAAMVQKRTKMVWSEMGWKPVIIGVIAYAVLLVLHETLFGIAPIGFVSGIFD